MNNHTDSGWVTYYTVRMPDGRRVAVQKRDGATRSIIGPAVNHIGGHGEMATNGHINPTCD